MNFPRFLYWLVYGVIVAAATALTINSVTMQEFLFSAALLIVFGSFLWWSVGYAYRTHEPGKGAKSGAVAFMVVLLAINWYLWVGAVITSFGGFMCFTAITPAHFRTNTVTGACNFGGSSSCAVNDPWYYRPGCEVSSEELLRTLQKSKYYDREVQRCMSACPANTFASSDFCTDTTALWGGRSANVLTCDHIVSCPGRTCS